MLIQLEPWFFLPRSFIAPAWGDTLVWLYIELASAKLLPENKPKEKSAAEVLKVMAVQVEHTSG